VKVVGGLCVFAGTKNESILSFLSPWLIFFKLEFRANWEEACECGAYPAKKKQYHKLKVYNIGSGGKNESVCTNRPNYATKVLLGGVETEQKKRTSLISIR